MFRHERIAKVQFADDAKKGVACDLLLVVVISFVFRFCLYGHLPDVRLPFPSPISFVRASMHIPALGHYATNIVDDLSG